MTQITFFFPSPLSSLQKKAEAAHRILEGLGPQVELVSVTSGCGEWEPGLERFLGGERCSTLCVCVCVYLSEGSVLLARTSCWHCTKAGSEVTEMSTETQADTYTEPFSERLNPLAPSSHAT